jgi:ketosteroid isomerase-like protein
VSEENVALLREYYDEWRRGNLAPGAFAPDAVFNTPASGRESLDLDGWRRFMQGFLQQWDDFRMEPLEFLDMGDAVVVTERQHGIARPSGMDLEQTFYTVWTFRDGLITGATWETDLESAKHTAGLTD